MLLNTYFSQWLSLRNYLKGTFLISHSFPNSASPLPSNLPPQISFRGAQMAPQTRSAARKQAALESLPKSDLPTNIESTDAKNIPELETTPTISKPRSNPFCLSKEQIDRISGYFANLPGSSEPHAVATRKHCDALPALSPTELDYLVTLLVPFYTPPPGPEAPLVSWQQPVDWSTVTAKFNDRFPKCHPRKEQVLMCAMEENAYRIVIASFRERCRRAHAGENNAGFFSTFTMSELDGLFTLYFSR